MRCRQIISCAICGRADLSLLWDLPKLPLTEKYGPYSANPSLYENQELLFCNRCSHVQLKQQIAPSELYAPSAYSFRTVQSKTAIEGTRFFHQFFLDIAPVRYFSSLVDIGGNGLLLATITENVEKKSVVDPVCEELNRKIIDGIRIYGSFIEEIDLCKEGILPDLIFSRHVLEHISKPKELLEQLFEQSAPEALFVFEIPCFDHLIEAFRFDAIFHQHYHYFTLSGFRILLEEVGGEYISHRYNVRGSCGGALLIAFRKGVKQKHQEIAVKDVIQKKKQLLRAIQQYQAQMSLLGWQLEKFKKDIYGYGASLMLATLGYHLKTDFSQLICLLDDDPQKDHCTYQNIPVTIRHMTPPANNNYLITSLENIRGIYHNITTKLHPKRVLVPLVA